MIQKKLWLSKYWWIFKLDWKQSVHYFSDYLLSALFIAIILFIFTHLWQTIFAGNRSVEGLTITQLIWYLTLTESIALSIGWRSMFDNVADDIKSGSIANYLTKPLSYMGWYFSSNLSKFFNYFATFIVIGGIVTYALVGPLHFSLLNLLPLVFLLILSFILSFFVGMAFVSLAFWFEDVTAFYWILQKALFILGGMLVPIDVYPEFVQQYLYYLPVSFITYWPAKYFVTGSADILYTAVLGQVIWGVIFFGIAVSIYKIGIRKVNIHGG